jgi:hypothetical protein
MTKASESPTDAGRRWAEERADSLVGTIAAVSWPDTWPVAWDEELDLPAEVEEGDTPAYRAAAHHAAAERWLELLEEQEVAWRPLSAL